MKISFSVIAVLIVVSMLLTIVPAHRAQADVGGMSDKDYWKLVEELSEYQSNSPVPSRVAAYDVSKSGDIIPIS